MGASLVVQWLRLLSSQCRGAQVISLVREATWPAVAPGLQRVGHDLVTKQQGTKLSHATTKTQCSQINK